MNTYPVAGYRTAEAARRGFQTFEERVLSQPMKLRGERKDRDAELFEDLLKKAFRPNTSGTPIRTGPGASIIPKVSRTAISLGSSALTRHPVFRAAQLAWEFSNFLPEPAVTYEEGTEPSPVPGTEWVECWGDCGPHPRKTGPTGWTSNDGGVCSPILQCIQNQAPGTYKAFSEPVPAGQHRYLWWEEHRKNTGSLGGYVRQVWTRPTATEAVQGPLQVSDRHAQFGPQTAPMPVPYRLAPHRRNSAVREAGYSLDTRTSRRRSPPGDGRPLRTRVKFPRHRPPGKKEKERKFALMSGGRLRNLIEAAFEGTEWVQDLHDALPKDCQVNGTVAQKFVAIASCFNQLDFCKAVENRVNNHIEDKVIGILGQAAKKSAIGSGKSYGLAGITKKLGKPYFDENGSLQFDPTLPFSIPRVSLGC